MARVLASIAVAFLSFLLVGCDDDDQASVPPPQELTREVSGHYCGMIVADHPGPKAQIYLKSREDPIWFTSVRDAVVFTMLPEEPKSIVVIYVTDMSKAKNWDAPEPGTWVEVREAWYVLESSRVGGMGAPEAVPFSDKADAEAFAGQFGGTLVRFDGIPPEYALSPVETPMKHGENQ
jgi:copper chaperone NosL